MRLGGDAVAVDGLRDHGVDADPLGGCQRVAGLQAAQLDDLGGDAGEALRLPRQALGEALDLLRLVGGARQGLGEEADGADRGLQLVADVGDEVASHVVEPVRLGAIVGEEQHEPVAEPRHPHEQSDLGLAERSASQAEFLADRHPVAAHLVDQLDELLVHERLVPHQAERERTRRGLDDVVRRVDHDPGGIQGVDDLVHAVREAGTHDGDGVLPATMRGDDRDGARSADDEAEGECHGHEPGRVHRTRLGRSIHPDRVRSGDRRPVSRDVQSADTVR